MQIFSNVMLQNDCIDDQLMLVPRLNYQTNDGTLLGQDDAVYENISYDKFMIDNKIILIKFN